MLAVAFDHMGPGRQAGCAKGKLTDFRLFIRFPIADILAGMGEPEAQFSGEREKV